MRYQRSLLVTALLPILLALGSLASAQQSGYYVLDGFGGVHAGGPIKGSSLAPTTPYFGFNVARAIALRREAPPRVARFTSSGNVLVTAQGSYTRAGSVTIVAPRSGVLLLQATAEVFCLGFGSAGNAVARMAVGLDSMSPALGVNYPVGIADCAAQTGPTYFQRNFSINAPFSVAAGTHTLYLLAINDGGTQTPVVSDRLISVTFID